MSDENIDIEELKKIAKEVNNLEKVDGETWRILAKLEKEENG